MLYFTKKTANNDEALLAVCILKSLSPCGSVTHDIGQSYKMQINLPDN